MNGIEDKRGFKGVWIPKEIWLNKDLTLQEKVFLVEIDSLDNDGGCYANNQHFAKFFNLSKNRCSEIISSLEEKKYITLTLIYEKGTKRVEKRILKINKLILNTPSENRQTPSENRQTPSENRQTPSENWEESNTVNNTISNIYIYSRVVDYLNQKAGTKYKSTTRKTQDLIRARLNEGFSEEEFLKVIDNKVTEWTGTEWEKYLTPTTLFGTKFENYLNQKIGGQNNGGFRKDHSETKNKWAGFKPADKSGIDWENDWEKYKDIDDPELI